MAQKSAIEWTDSTWSPIRVRVKANAAEIARARGYTSLVQIAEKMAGRVGQHCEHVSPECENCYAETNNERCLPHNGTGLPYDRRSRDLVDAFVDQVALLQPLKWKPVLTGIQSGEGQLKQVTHKDGSVTVTRERSRRIFVENQSDLFAEWVTDEMLDRVFALMALCPQHTFQVLTKRPERMLAYLRMVKGEKDMQRWINAAYAADPNLAPSMAGEMEYLQFPLPNVWLGVSAGTQKAADERIPLLLQTPAAVRFISAEPLLGAVRFDRLHEEECAGDFEHCGECGSSSMYVDAFTAHAHCGGAGCNAPGEALAQGRIDWVICGGESGPNARPLHPDWARSQRDQCTAAGVRFFFKQWGKYLPLVYMGDLEALPRSGRRMIWLDGEVTAVGEERDARPGYAMQPVGKHAAGALLEGREWREFPAVPA